MSSGGGAERRWSRDISLMGGGIDRCAVLRGGFSTPLLLRRGSGRSDLCSLGCAAPLRSRSCRATVRESRPVSRTPSGISPNPAGAIILRASPCPRTPSRPRTPPPPARPPAPPKTSPARPPAPPPPPAAARDDLRPQTAEEGALGRSAVRGPRSFRRYSCPPHLGLRPPFVEIVQESSVPVARPPALRIGTTRDDLWPGAT